MMKPLKTILQGFGVGAIVMLAIFLILDVLAQPASTIRLRDLQDVRTVTTPSNGQVLAYDSASGKWTNATAAGSGGTVGLANFNSNQFGTNGGTVSIKTGATTTNLGIAGATITGNVTNTATGSFQVAVGTTGQRPVTPPFDGMVRFNSTVSRYEFGSSSSWQDFVKLDGDTMTDYLTLVGDPVLALQAASKQYVDNSVTNIVDAQISASAAIAKSKISTSGTWAAADIPSLDASKITSGTISSNRLPTLVKDLSNITGVAGDLFWYDGTNFTRLPKGTEGFILVTSNGVPTWTTNIDQATITNLNTTVVNATTINVHGKSVPAVHINGTNTAPDLNFTNSATITFANTSGSSNWTANLANTGTAGTYRSVTFDAQGRETAGTNPTTFSGYGLSDTSANLAAAITDESGTGLVLFGTGPSIAGATLSGTTTNTSTFSGTFTNTGAMGVSGAATLGSTLGVIGASTLSGAVTEPSAVVTNFVQFPWTTLTMSGTNVSAVNLVAGTMFKLTLTNNAYFGVPSGLPGTNLAQTIQIHFLQDGTGTRTVTMTNSAWILAGSGASTNAVPTINTNANGVTILTFVTSPFSSTLLYGVPTAYTP